MNERQFVLTQVRGLVISNDGYFAEVELGGVEGIEKGLFLATIQLHPRGSQTEDEFLREFPVGMLMTIRTVRTVTLIGLAEFED